MEQPTSIKVHPVDLPRASSPIVVTTTRLSRTAHLLSLVLEKLDMKDETHKYQLVVGVAGEEPKWACLEPDDCPALMMEEERKKGSGRRLLIRKIPETTSLLTSLTEGISSGNDEESAINIDDLCQYNDLTEQSMLSILKERFTKDQIYTYIGSILIAINPYHVYSIYNPKYSDLYQGHNMYDLPPHIFAIADDSYSSMLDEKKDQAVIISGESGAGKTESTKFLLHQLMMLSAKFEETSSLDLITLGTGPVLEAFGNAKTVANDNSSRFGKFIQVKFKENGAYYGASIEKYLLEKSRIVSQATNERNYHVFYYLLSGADSALRNKLHLLPLDQYRYLGRSRGTPFVKETEDPADFHRLCESLKMLNFSTEIQHSMFTVLSAILHIGNIEFEKNQQDETVHISTLSTVHVISQLLKVDQHILSTALISRKSKAGGMDSFVTHYRHDEAIATCDAMAKALYGALFDWIVNKVNEALIAQYASKLPHKGNTIGVLDIFGFEVFQKNSFEQFCINYANEQLQQYFNKHIFKLEQVEYESEGIEWKNIEFIDNHECIELIAKKPTGLLPLLDEECSFPGADDLSLFEKFERQHKNSSCYSSPPMKRVEPVFTIAHYASPVTYAIKGFREKNRDLMRQDVVEVLKTSRMDLVRALIGVPSYATHRWHVVTGCVLGSVRFMKAGNMRRERKDKEWTQSMPVISDSTRGGKKSKSTSSKSPEKSNDPKFTNVFQPSNQTIDETDVVDGGHTDRRPSIAHLLKKKWNSSVRARLEGRRGQEGDKTTNKDKMIYQSAPRVKYDSTRSGSGGKLQQMAGAGSSRRGQSTRTVSAEFHSSLVQLMEQLERTHPYFVRCIKSNQDKAPRQFDSNLVIRQLQYTGMIQTIKIRKSGYPVRIPFEDFYEKYQFLIGRKEDDLPSQIREFLVQLGFSNTDIQIGHTKVFMKDKEKRVLQTLLQEKVLSKIIVIQRWIRAKLHRCRFLQVKRSVLIIQCYARGFLMRKMCGEMRGRVYSAVIIQSSWRRYSCRRKFLEAREASIVLQARWRGVATRKRYQTLLQEQRERKSSQLHQIDSNDEVWKEVDTTLDHLDSIINEFNNIDSSSTHTPVVKEILVTTPPTVKIEEVKPVGSESSLGSRDSHMTNRSRSPSPKREGPPTAKKPIRNKSPTENRVASPVITETNTTPPVSKETVTMPSVATETKTLDDDLLLDSLSDEDVEVTELVVIETKDSPTVLMRSNSALSPRWTGVRPLDQKSRKQKTRSVGDSTEIKKRVDGLDDRDLSKAVTPDEVYLLNYQIRHSSGYDSGDTGQTGNPSDRFVVAKKKWGKKLLKGIKKDPMGAGQHPLLSKVQRLSSPVSSGGESGSSTPTPAPSPRKQLKSNKISSPQELNQHVFKTSLMNKNQLCMCCNKSFSGFLKNGSKCVVCGLIVHKHCQNRVPLCSDFSKVGQQVTMATEVVVNHLEDLNQLAQFLIHKHHIVLNQLSVISHDKIEPVDTIFHKSLCEFHCNLVANYSLSVNESSEISPSSSDKPTVQQFQPMTFDQLVNKFSNIYRSLARHENLVVSSCDVAICVNQIRTFLDEFIKSKQQPLIIESVSSSSRPKQQRKTRFNKNVHIKTVKGHKFELTQFKVVTVCDQCSDLIKVLEKGEVCQECSFACHEACTRKISLKCVGKGWSRGGGDTKNESVTALSPSSKALFGVPLESLVPPGVVKVPTVLEKCLTCIENNGLYTQGIYRRSAGGNSKRAIREALEQDPEAADLDHFSLYAVAATVTSFFRELPEPLLTRNLYKDFIRATDLSDVFDRMDTFHCLINRLPDLNHCVFERIVFHLARVAQQESMNKMNPHNLAIIFAPTLLQCPGGNNVSPDELLQMLPKQTMVLESVLNEQLQKITITLKDIQDLSSVARSTANRLSALNTTSKKDQLKPNGTASTEGSSPIEDKEDPKEIKKKLTSDLQKLEMERATLTANLPKLEPLTSNETSREILRNHSSSSSITSSQDEVFGTGQDEFMKRRMMFGGKGGGGGSTGVLRKSEAPQRKSLSDNVKQQFEASSLDKENVSKSSPDDRKEPIKKKLVSDGIKKQFEAMNLEKDKEMAREDKKDPVKRRSLTENIKKQFENAADKEKESVATTTEDRKEPPLVKKKSVSDNFKKQLEGLQGLHREKESSSDLSSNEGREERTDTSKRRSLTENIKQQFEALSGSTNDREKNAVGSRERSPLTVEHRTTEQMEKKVEGQEEQINNERDEDTGQVMVDSTESGGVGTADDEGKLEDNHNVVEPPADPFPDLGPIQVLVPLTKNRVKQPALVKRRIPSKLRT